MFILKIYNSQFATIPIMQIEEINSCKIKLDLLNFSTMDISIPIIDGLKEYQKIEMCEIGNTDTVLFQGYIYEIRPTITDLSIFCRSQKAIFNKMILRTDKTYNSSLSTILTDIIGERNTRATETWTTNIPVDTSSLTKDFKKGDNYYDIINDLATLSGFVRDVKDNIITIGEITGDDLTGTTDFTELVYNIYDPTENNIGNIQFSQYGTIGNYVLATDGTNYEEKQDNNSISYYNILLEDYKSFRQGEVLQQATSYIEKNSQIKKIIDIEVEPFSITANLGDKVAVRIDGGNTYLDFEGDAYVISKEIELKNMTKIEKYGLSNIYIKRDNLTNKLINIQEKINLLNLNP